MSAARCASPQRNLYFHFLRNENANESLQVFPAAQRVAFVFGLVGFEQSNAARMSAAAAEPLSWKTLRFLGYTDCHVGRLWRPPRNDILLSALF